MGGVFRSEGINLVDRRHKAKLFAPFTDGEASLFHLHAVLEADGSGYLEVAEAIDLGRAQQQGDLWRLQVLAELARFHKLGDLRQVGALVELLVDVNNVLQLLQEPAIDHRQLMNLLDAVAYLHGLGHDEDTHVRRLM